MPSSGQRAELGGKIVKGSLCFTTQRLTQDLPHFGLRRMSAACGPAFQPSNQLVVQIAYAQTGHTGPLIDLTDSNESIRLRCGQFTSSASRERWWAVSPKLCSM